MFDVTVIAFDQTTAIVQPGEGALDLQTLLAVRPGPDRLPAFGLTRHMAYHDRNGRLDAALAQAFAQGPIVISYRLMPTVKQALAVVEIASILLMASASKVSTVKRHFMNTSLPAADQGAVQRLVAW